MMNDFEKALVDKITELHMDIDICESKLSALRLENSVLKDRINQLENKPVEEADN